MLRQFIFIDNGNTALKGQICDENFRPLNSFTLKTDEFLSEWESLISHPENTEGIYASVGPLSDELKNLFENKLQLRAFNAKIPLPIQVAYETPETLGADRLAIAIGGYSLHPQQNVLVMDFGTCLKCDFVSKAGYYEGGSISPGLDMRFKAMHTFTAKLPLLNRPENFPTQPIGRSTQQSMQHGVLLGMRAEAEGMAQFYRDLYPDLRVLITGGDAEVFEGRLKNAIFVRQNLALLGLAETMKYNANAPK